MRNVHSSQCHKGVSETDSHIAGGSVLFNPTANTLICRTWCGKIRTKWRIKIIPIRIRKKKKKTK